MEKNELTVKKLREENERLRQESEKWKRYVARLSHRLRTPLNAISGLSSVIKNCRHNPDEVLECVNKMDFASQMLVNIVSSVEEFSAVVDDEPPAYNSRFDLKLFVSSISFDFTNQCKDDGIEYSVSCDNIAEEELVGDSIHLNQALFSMLNFALASTQEGGRIELSVSQTRLDRSNVMLQLAMKDNGCGFTEKELEELWDITGCAKIDFSLAPTKRIIERMGGDLSARSVPGEGTTLTATVPFAIASETDESMSDSLTVLRILMIGLDSRTKNSVCEILRRVGADFTCVESTEEAVAAIKAAGEGVPYGLCFADWTSGEEDVAESVESLRYISGETPMYIAAIINYDNSDIRNEAYAAGADSVLAKPIFQSTIFNIMVELSGKMYKKTGVVRGEFDLTGSCVLLCEDNELNAELALELLNSAGLEVDCAMNGNDAVATFEASEPGTYDAVLMDIKMPEKDGFEAAQEIRALKRPDAKTVPIIALTADAFAGDIAKAKDSGMNDYIVKPIDTRLLYQTLERNIKGKLE
jgi:CheY-like chemotaxis protein